MQRKKMKPLLPSLAVVLLLVVVNSQLSSADTIPCKKQTGCMCETDDFAIDISKAFAYPFNQSYDIPNDDKTLKTYYMTFDCNSQTCNTDTEAALCQYDPGHDVSTSWGKSTQVTWTVTSRYSFKVLYQKGTPTSGSAPRYRQTEITFTVVNDTSEPAALTYRTEDDSDVTVITYIFNAQISANSPSPTPPGPAPHCYNNDQLVMIIGVSSAVAIAVFTLMVATIGAVVIWVCGKGRQPIDQTRKPKFQYAQLEKSQVL